MERFGRSVEPLLDRMLAAFSAVLLVGPRATGKTTLSLPRSRTTLRLDRPDVAAAVSVDVDAGIVGAEPVLLDEWQRVPDVLGALKRAVDAEPRPGRFLLTGSASLDLDAPGWPATGRVVRLPVWGLTQRELSRRPDGVPFFARVRDGWDAAAQLPAEVPDVRGYVVAALRSGFPEAVRLDDDDLRELWLASYVDQVVARDIPAVGGSRDPGRLRRYLQAIAANTAAIPEHKTLYDAAEINRLTAQAYDGLLELVHVTERIPAWSNSRMQRLVSLPKRVLTDPGLMVPLIGVSAEGVLRDSSLIGQCLETFVFSQLRAELPLVPGRPALSHLRQANGRREIDIIAEFADGSIVAAEVKATSAPTSAMAQHLQWFADQLGDRCAATVLLHAGPRPFRIGSTWALPIASIWA